MHFFFEWGTDSNNLKQTNKQTLPFWISEEHLSVLFYATPFLVWISALIEWLWDCYQFLVSSIFRTLVKIGRSFSYFGIFIAYKKEGISQLSLRISPKKQNWAITRQDVHRKALLCYDYTNMVFWSLLTFLKCFY